MELVLELQVRQGVLVALRHVPALVAVVVHHLVQGRAEADAQRIKAEAAAEARPGSVWITIMFCA